jgi:hypothetical protein
MMKVFLISHLISNFTPLHKFLNYFEKYAQYLPILEIIYRNVLEIISCQKCLSFWIGMYMCGFWIGVLIYYIVYLYQNIIENRINTIKLPKIF